MSTLTPERWLEVSPYLDHVLSLPEAERPAWLDSFRTEKPELVDVLRSLLEEQRAVAAEHFLENRPAPPTGTSLEGQKIGPYTLISPIGQGGMGSVWLAEGSDGRFERRVAVKFLHLFLMGVEGVERFKREGRILAQLAHPHIAELIDAGVTPSISEPGAREWRAHSRLLRYPCARRRRSSQTLPRCAECRCACACEPRRSSRYQAFQCAGRK